MEFNFVFLNETPYFLLYVLAAYLENVPKYYNKVFFKYFSGHETWNYIILQS